MYKSNEIIEEEVKQNWQAIKGTKMSEDISNYIKGVRLQDIQAIKEIIDGMKMQVPEIARGTNTIDLTQRTIRNLGFNDGLEKLKVKLDELMNK